MAHANVQHLRTIYPSHELSGEGPDTEAGRDGYEWAKSRAEHLATLLTWVLMHPVGRDSPYGKKC